MIDQIVKAIIPQEKKEVNLAAIDLLNYDLTQIDEWNYSVIKNGMVYRINILQTDLDTKSIKLSINGVEKLIVLEDELDIRLSEMGFETNTAADLKELNAPMPGLILDVLVSPGDIITQGANLLILEAMKMENILKASTDRVVSSVLIDKGDKVEKGQKLLEFE